MNSQKRKGMGAIGWHALYLFLVIYVILIVAVSLRGLPGGESWAQIIVGFVGGAVLSVILTVILVGLWSWIRVAWLACRRDNGAK